MIYKAPRGTSDLLPGDRPFWDYVTDKAETACRLFGYGRIETPAFEDAALFTRSVGEGTDIVSKEMYVFKDRSDNELALRPEGTAPVCRAYMEHGLGNLAQPVRLYYFADIFRYERPQAGRYRQHHQFGCEAIGESSPVVDAEVIHLAFTFFSSLGLQRFSLNLNSIGCRQCRPSYLKQLRQYYEPLAAGLCDDCRTRLVKNTLRLLDCKKPQCQSAAEAAPQSAGHLCGDCANHFGELRDYLAALKIDFVLNHRLVRGLDYYTRTVFEIQPAEGGSQSALGGGGRYDDLISQLGGKPTPALGFAAGLERIVANLKNEGIEVPQPARPAVYIACLGQKASIEGLRLAALIRGAGLTALISAGGRSLKAQLRQANAWEARYAVIIGDDEVKSGTVMLRDMESSEQQEVASGELLDLVNQLK